MSFFVHVSIRKLLPKINMNYCDCKHRLFCFSDQGMFFAMMIYDGDEDMVMLWLTEGVQRSEHLLRMMMMNRRLRPCIKHSWAQVISLGEFCFVKYMQYQHIHIVIFSDSKHCRFGNVFFNIVIIFILFYYYCIIRRIYLNLSKSTQSAVQCLNSCAHALFTHPSIH